MAAGSKLNHHPRLSIPVSVCASKKWVNQKKLGRTIWETGVINQTFRSSSPIVFCGSTEGAMFTGDEHSRGSNKCRVGEHLEDEGEVGSDKDCKKGRDEPGPSLQVHGIESGGQRELVSV